MSGFSISRLSEGFKRDVELLQEGQLIGKEELAKSIDYRTYGVALGVIGAAALISALILIAASASPAGPVILVVGGLFLLTFGHDFAVTGMNRGDYIAGGTGGDGLMGAGKAVVTAFRKLVLDRPEDYEGTWIFKDLHKAHIKSF